MEKFSFTVLEHVKVWKHRTIQVTAESKEAAYTLLENKHLQYGFEIEAGEPIEDMGDDEFGDDAETLTPDVTLGATVEIIEEDDRTITVITNNYQFKK